ncbi:DUF421 domain-containing protein [Nonlabens ponticola]|uniref:DUF421 domain-containing protein n=1 Tax=Nonlabens ponticola TaxID=2496866 RepID=A0A3S9MVB3_9FLAO|nr:YetF domain-containing protein [Nonlabens ponticola]AZQ43093.1 DUF421 domain-containing protein [Nonlabens ponticola]
MSWIYSADDPLWQTIVLTFILFLTIVLLTRIIGLRSFAKFTAYDFAFTIAIGSIVAGVLTSSTTFVHGAVAVASLLGLTFIFSQLQRKYPWLESVISNKPLMLMDGNQILDDNLAHARIERSQLMAKLREANVLNFDQVRAVVLESTGDISVLHTSDKADEVKLANEILDGVRKTV